MAQVLQQRVAILIGGQHGVENFDGGPHDSTRACTGQSRTTGRDLEGRIGLSAFTRGLSRFGLRDNDLVSLIGDPGFDRVELTGVWGSRTGKLHPRSCTITALSPARVRARNMTPSTDPLASASFDLRRSVSFVDTAPSDPG